MSESESPSDEATITELSFVGHAVPGESEETEEVAMSKDTDRLIQPSVPEGHRNSGAEDGGIVFVDGEPYNESHSLSRVEKWRNIAGFWVLGLCNNYPYVIMLSAAFDILSSLESDDSSSDDSSNPRDCNKQSTSVVLIADILPTFLIKLVMPYCMNFIPYWIRVLSVVVFSLASFVLVGVGLNEPLVLFGVVCASISTGFGEITYLSLTARYDKSTVSAWSSGTGAAGIGGALIYAGLTSFLSPKVTLYIQTFVPFLMAVTYFLVLGKAGNIIPDVTPPTVNITASSVMTSEEVLTSTRSSINLRKVKLFNREEVAYWYSHVRYIPNLIKFMVPLFAVYVAEYMINQGLFELFNYPDTHIGKLNLDHHGQYRWLQVIYQLGVFISRSSVNVVHLNVDFLWLLAMLQVINFIFLFYEAVYMFIPSFWITFFFVLYEGLLGGAVYVNAFYSIAKQVPKIHREFSMGVASVGDSTGITVAGIVSIFLHNYICGLPPHNK